MGKLLAAVFCMQSSMHVRMMRKFSLRRCPEEFESVSATHSEKGHFFAELIAIASRRLMKLQHQCPKLITDK
jgi:hypothetical protein